MMFRDIDVTNKVLDATMMKFGAVVGNVTNVDTPGYKRQEVSFETQLESEIQKNGTKNITVENLSPVTYTDRSTLSYRIDGNNVDIDKEMSELAQVKLRYDALIQRANAQIRRYTYILQNIK
ncbi:flagellar basal body rod protein FlgB [Niameybacter massiliensis]|uniref:Flagellar basal body rod protein FlgB n=1 Tax=Holtiella tumoricola TaxID=3018743 RepID=A0AA42DPS2_9FIRM|nr:flagellar basal body rod protein FlgB [Holtiella tumoricola]MDA3732581.1 flagellar basal body rod protein FlgB [Holtiella tumoricola]